MIPVAEIRRNLSTDFVGKKVETFEIVDSTNSVARKLAETGAPEGTVVFAEYQTSGRGRLQRTWYAERGKSILLSVILRPSERDIAKILTYVTALSAAETVESVAGVSIECKWPNDLLINGKKLCGILLESSWDRGAVAYLIIGLGMNVNEETFPVNLQNTATSLRIECGREFDRAEIIRALLQNLESQYLKTRRGEFQDQLSAWQARCPMIGKKVQVEQAGRAISGTALRLDPDGALVLQEDQREVKIFAGDVTVLQ